MTNRISLGAITRIGGLVAIAFSSTEPSITDFTLRLILSKDNTFTVSSTNKVFILTKPNQSIQGGTNTLLLPFEAYTNFSEFENGGFYRLYINDVFENSGESQPFIEG